MRNSQVETYFHPAELIRLAYILPISPMPIIPTERMTMIAVKGIEIKINTQATLYK